MFLIIDWNLCHMEPSREICRQMDSPILWITPILRDLRPEAQGKLELFFSPVNIQHQIKNSLLYGWLGPKELRWGHPQSTENFHLQNLPGAVDVVMSLIVTEVYCVSPSPLRIICHVSIILSHKHHPTLAVSPWTRVMCWVSWLSHVFSLGDPFDRCWQDMYLLQYWI